MKNKLWIVLGMLFMIIILQHFWYRGSISELREITNLQSSIIKQQMLVLEQMEETIDKLSSFLEDGSYKQKTIQHLLRKVHLERTVLATVTAYTPTKEECDSTPMIAASMERVREGTVAVSRDLFYSGWTFGKKIYIEGKGIFQINDLMNERFEKRIDVFMWKKHEAKRFGKLTTRAILLEEMG